VQGALGGFVVLVLAVMGTFVFNRLWQRSLLAEAAEAIAEAQAKGFVLHPLGFGPRVVLSVTQEEGRAEICWCGGVYGARTLIRVGKEQRTLALLTTAQALNLALAGEE
jgi:hypothetical protein